MPRFADAGANTNIYMELTREFNRGRVRAILGGGQAAVLHRLAFMSKDGGALDAERRQLMRANEERLAQRVGLRRPAPLPEVPCPAARRLLGTGRCFQKKGRR